MSQAPRAPPRSEGGIRRFAKSLMPARSSRWPQKPPMEPGQRARVLVTLACWPVRPMPSRAGKDTRVPPPAMELIAPAVKAAAMTVSSCQMCMPPR